MSNRRRRQTRTRLDSGTRWTRPYPPFEHNAMIARRKALRRFSLRLQGARLRDHGAAWSRAVAVEAFGRIGAAAAAAVDLVSPPALAAARDITAAHGSDGGPVNVLAQAWADSEEGTDD